MRRTLAVVVWLVAASTLVLALFLEAGSSYVVVQVGIAAAFVGWATIGLMLTARQPDNRVGWLLIATAFFGPMFLLGEQLALFVSRRDFPLSAGQAALAFAGLSFTFTFVSLTLLFLVFPTGRLLTQRWRIAVWLAATAGAVVVMGIGPVARSVVDVEQFLLNNWSLDHAGQPVGWGISASLSVINFLTVAIVIVGAVALVARMRTTMGAERQQVKWVVYSGALTALIWAVFLFPGLPVWVLPIGSIPLAILLTAGFAIGLFRYRLYDIDRIINRTVVYVMVVTVLAALYGAIVAGIPLLLPATENQDLLVAGATLVAFFLFSPLRRRVQRFVDRRFYRSRYDAEQVVEAFSTRRVTRWISRC